MRWVLIFVGVLGGLATLGYTRNNYFPCRRLAKFLSAHGVKFAGVEYRPHYGWPGYAVVFDSEYESRAFRASPVFDALLNEVQAMHPDVRHATNRFEARLAVSLDPPVFDAPA